jgi:hypothetical protein
MVVRVLSVRVGVLDVGVCRHFGCSERVCFGAACFAQRVEFSLAGVNADEYAAGSDGEPGAEAKQGSWVSVNR